MSLRYSSSVIMLLTQSGGVFGQMSAFQISHVRKESTHCSWGYFRTTPSVFPLCLLLLLIMMSVDEGRTSEIGALGKYERVTFDRKPKLAETYTATRTASFIYKASRRRCTNLQFKLF